MPTPQELLPVLFDETLDFDQFVTWETLASLQSDRIEPELRLVVVALDVNMRRLCIVTGIKEESVRARKAHAWHDILL
jgi:hypothetical protein